MKIITNDAVYVQKNDMGFLNQTDLLIPVSVFLKVFGNGITIIDDSNRFEFIKFEDKEEIEFFIGDSGASFDEFEHLDVNINSFKSNLLQKVNDYNCKDLHFIVRTDC